MMNGQKVRWILWGLCYFFSISTAFAQKISNSSSSTPDAVAFQDGRDYFSYQEPINLPEREDHKILIQFFF